MLNVSKPKPKLPTGFIPPKESGPEAGTPPAEGKPESILARTPQEVLIRGFANLYQPVIFSAGQTVTVTSFDLESPKVPTGRLWVITSLCAIDLTTGFTSLRWLIGGMGYDHFMDEQSSLTVNVLYSFKWLPVYLGEGKSIVARLAGITSGDRIQLFGNGVEIVLR